MLSFARAPYATAPNVFLPAVRITWALLELFKIKHFFPRAPCQFNLGLRTRVKRLVRCKKAGMLPHLTPGHTHPPPTISPLPLNRCCSIAVWSLECLPAQALCQSHPPQWPSLVLQMGLISDSQRQNAQRSSPQHSVLRCCLGTRLPASGGQQATHAGSTTCSKLTVLLPYGKRIHHVDRTEYISKDLFSTALLGLIYLCIYLFCVLYREKPVNFF